jgi:hypothetical protein
VVGGWWLVVGGWWLVVGGWSLVIHDLFIPLLLFYININIISGTGVYPENKGQMPEIGSYQEPLLLVPQHYMTSALFSSSADIAINRHRHLS